MKEHPLFFKITKYYNSLTINTQLKNINLSNVSILSKIFKINRISKKHISCFCVYSSQKKV